MSRKLWFAQDAMFLSDDSVRALIHHFGCPGPLVVTHLLGAAKIQDERGRVRMSYRAIKEYASLDRPLGSWWSTFLPQSILNRVGGHGDDLARAIVSGLEELGFFRGLTQTHTLGEDGFDGEITDWWEWQFPTRSLTPAERQRAKRARDKGFLVDPEGGDVIDPETGEVTGSIFDPSRDVSLSGHGARDTSVTPQTGESGAVAA